MICCAALCTSIPVEHGYIQVRRSSLDNVLFQSVTSQEIFSDRKEGMHTYAM